MTYSLLVLLPFPSPSPSFTFLFYKLEFQSLQIIKMTQLPCPFSIHCTHLTKYRHYLNQSQHQSYAYSFATEHIWRKILWLVLLQICKHWTQEKYIDFNRNNTTYVLISQTCNIFFPSFLPRLLVAAFNFIEKIWIIGKHWCTPPSYLPSYQQIHLFLWLSLICLCHYKTSSSTCTLISSTLIYSKIPLVRG